MSHPSLDRTVASIAEQLRAHSIVSKAADGSTVEYNIPSGLSAPRSGLAPSTVLYRAQAEQHGPAPHASRPSNYRSPSPRPQASHFRAPDADARMRQKPEHELHHRLTPLQEAVDTTPGQTSYLDSTQEAARDRFERGWRRSSLVAKPNARHCPFNSSNKTNSPYRSSTLTATDSQRASESLQHLHPFLQSARTAHQAQQTQQDDESSRAASSYRPRPLPPSGVIPDPSKKIYCTYWVKNNECMFIAQGCRYKHEMPDLRTLREHVGLKDYPKWWKDKCEKERHQKEHSKKVRSEKVSQKKSEKAQVTRTMDSRQKSRTNRASKRSGTASETSSAINTESISSTHVRSSGMQENRRATKDKIVLESGRAHAPTQLHSQHVRSSALSSPHTPPSDQDQDDLLGLSSYPALAPQFPDSVFTPPEPAALPPQSGSPVLSSSASSASSASTSDSSPPPTLSRFPASTFGSKTKTLPPGYHTRLFDTTADAKSCAGKKGSSESKHACIKFPCVEESLSNSQCPREGRMARRVKGAGKKEN